jgi:hypothetical protein
VANERYHGLMATLNSPHAGLRSIDTMAKPARNGGRSYRGGSLFLNKDFAISLAIARGEWTLSGFRALDLRHRLPALSAHRASHVPKRLCTRGLIKKVGHRYKYSLTNLGRRVVATTLVLRETVMTPALAQAVQ